MGEGVRTLGHWSHNPALYQLSYAHHAERAVYQMTEIRGALTEIGVRQHEEILKLDESCNLKS